MDFFGGPNFDGVYGVPVLNGVYQWDQGEEPWKHLPATHYRWNPFNPLASLRSICKPGWLDDDLPNLIWCKIYNSTFPNRVCIFFAAFVFQNPNLFTLAEFRTILEFVNLNFSVARWSCVMEKYRYFIDLLVNAPAGLCDFYAYDCVRSFVLDLPDMTADPAMDGAFLPNDPCRLYMDAYNRCVDW